MATGPEEISAEDLRKSLDGNYLVIMSTKRVALVATGRPDTCATKKCNNSDDLQKYRGKYYCTDCLNKKLRW